MPVVRISQAAALAMLAACKTEIESGGGGSPNLRIYEGAMPASVDTAITTQVLLVDFDLPLPAFSDPIASGVGATMTAEDIDPVAAIESSSSATPTLFARLFDLDDNGVVDFDVSDPAGTGALKIDALQIVAGVNVTVVSLTISQRSA